MTKSKISAIVLVFLIPYFLVYRAFFTSAALVWGDAPYFYSENLDQLFNIPFVWNNIFDNFGTDVSYKLWLYIPTFLYGVLYKVFGFNNEILIRLVFYFPATIFSLIGSYLLISRFSKNAWANTLGSLFYGFNTYFLLLLDGGQIGVALAFGLFPVTVWAFSNFWEKKNSSSFALIVISLFLIFNSDLRIGLVAVLFSMCLDTIFYENINRLFEKFRTKILPITIVLLLSGFWVWPFLYNGGADTISSVSGDKSFVTILHSLFVYQPHFPINEFGRTQLPPFYFFGVLVLALLPLFFNESRQNIRLVSLFLLFVFLTKGNSDPSGFIYSKALDILPFGSAFRDSSKFFIPLILTTSILISISTEQIFRLVKKVFYKRVVFFLIYSYLILLIYPAVIGNLTGVLAGRFYPLDYQKIYSEINKEDEFFRTVWFPEKNSFAPSFWGKEAISANQLYQEMPFSSMILGNYDLYNFLSNDQLSDWFSLAGIKYAFFPDNERKKTWTPRENYERQLFLDYVDKISGFEKINWAGEVVGYKVSDPKPKIFTQEKVFIVLGDTSIYKFWKRNSEVGLMDIGFIFLEDGITKIDNLLLLPKDSAILIVKDRSKEDLGMVLNIPNFVPVKKITKNDWGKILGNQRIYWRYEFLKQGIDSDDLGFGNDYFYSSIANEKLNLEYKIKKEEKYYLGFRQISATSSGGITVKVSSKTFDIVSNKTNNFNWQLLGPFDFSSNKIVVEFRNNSGFNAINTPILLKEKDLIASKSKIDEVINRFQFHDVDKDGISIQNELSKVSDLTYSEDNPTKYKINLNSNGSTWVIFSDHYNSGWYLNDDQPYPMYSMINGFYLDENFDGRDLVLEYIPQRQVKIGILISVASALILIVGCVLYSKRR